MDEVEEIVKKHPLPVITYKQDGSPVTCLDLALSEYFEELFIHHFPGHNFYSEEKFSNWAFPMIALDPLDGTKEYIHGRAEWSVSISILEDDKFHGQGVIINPLTQEIFANYQKQNFRSQKHYRGEVSRSEWESGLFKNTSSEKYSLTPMGSIAYKLGRLANGDSDFVISLRPKNIWDIAAGTILCHQAGIKFYSKGKEVTEAKPYYEPPLIWCFEENFLELSSLWS